MIFGVCPGQRALKTSDSKLNLTRTIAMTEAFVSQFEKMNSFFLLHQTRSLAFRLEQLKTLEKLIKENTPLILEALYKDLRKPEAEALMGEIGIVLEEINFTKKELNKWMKPKSVSTPVNLWPAKSQIIYEPKGVVLIISPWNYPFQLAMSPLVGAIAAGNCSVIKPSEMTQYTSKLIIELVKKYFDANYITAVEGGIDETTALLKLPWHHLFFTGSTPVGKIIMKAAAENLTPVTLELGGKSPAIVNHDADIGVTAKRLVWGKFYNAGQTCVAPDYVYVHKSVKQELIDQMITEMKNQFGPDYQQSLNYGRIINTKNLDRLKKLISKDQIIYGGEINDADLFISPTLANVTDWSDPLMQDEVFGPILPIIEFEDLDSIFNLINQKQKPLAAYLFSNSEKIQNQFLDEVSFGGGCINDVVIHLGNPHLPFGGTHQSGHGSYHGHYSFLTFSHQKSVLQKSVYLDLPIRYPPYSETKIKMIRRFLGL